MASKQTASVGRIVHAVVDERINNGQRIAPALITSVHKNDDDETVNLRVFLDTGADLRWSNVSLTEASKDGVDELDTKSAFWPPRA